MKIAPSILSADLAELKQDVLKVEKAGADWIHIDSMDGHFVPNLTFGSNIVKAIRPHTDLPLDCHLMIENPEDFIQGYVDAGADSISIHAESTNHLHRAIQLIKQNDVKAGVVLNPATPVSLLEDIIGMVDLVLVMTVNPGYGGQSFIPNTLEKIRTLKQWKARKNLSYDIQVDGGVNDQTIKLCADAGANVFVAGSYVYNAEDVDERIQLLKEAVQ